jgi:lipopolysaccharide/colanic/teichoic acid biosynthesis glycosyltransferase
MIRIRGFARKTRRPTKGGSLPAPAREISARNGQSDDDQSALKMGNNGHSNGNGTDAIHRNGTTDRISTATARGINGIAVGAERNGDSLTSYLHDVVEQLIEPTAPVEGRPPLNVNGHGVSVDGEAPRQLETVFARAAFSADSVKPSPLWKRVFDITCVLLTLPIWLPLLLLVMAWIKMVSPGPIFYRQERVGYRRSRFMIFKFRTMHVNAETRTHEEYFAHLMRANCPMTKLDALDDNRLIRCGRFLRAIGLDELPQLFNVLRGEMSLVGPRPCLPTEFDRYTPAQQQRVNARPGLTGYWQVNGKNKTTFSEMIAMDIYYSEHMSLWLDLRIILKTAPALICQTFESQVRRSGDVVGARVATAGFNGSATKI